MKSTALIFPHQLFEENPLFEKTSYVTLIEETLFFHQYKFHQQKIAFHRASMRFYADYLKDKGLKVQYISAVDENCDVRRFIQNSDFEKIYVLDVEDDWLGKRIQHSVQKKKIALEILPSPLFINSKEDLRAFFKPEKKKFHQTTFYKQQRKQRNILLENGKPKGGKWTFDTENRKKYPKDKTPPATQFPNTDKYFIEAKTYVEKNFSHHYGKLSQTPLFPYTFDAAKEWFRQFLRERFYQFGDYEDAIVSNEMILNHSVLSPLINCGLLTPDFVLSESISYAEKHKIPINSLEGFVRQILGWREFIRGIYITKGVEERNRNFWNFTNDMPAAFYNANTGILPIDKTIRKTLNTSYAHHIERLMLLSNFMLLCEIKPNAVYQWFMEMYIDAYDWVMVPNVYGMSQFADGGLMSTKPYISSSNYVMKMSDYGKGDWQQIWDALFWWFMHVHRAFFESNPRLGLLLRNLDKKSHQELQTTLDTANDYLKRLFS